jgi:hypothetical protein
MRMVSIAIGLLLPVLSVASCFDGPGDDAQADTEASGPECTPGDTRNCTCSGVLGMETCNAAGDAWGSCECGMTTGASSPTPTSGPNVTSLPPNNDTGDDTTGSPPATSTGEPSTTTMSDPSTTGMSTDPGSTGGSTGPMGTGSSTGAT